MLKQILRDMYVAPEILAELPEEQKQILFFKIREEQKRRYYLHDEEFLKKESKRKKGKEDPHARLAGRKRVKILEDSNSQPWTWVMGEHPNDIPIESLWANPGKDMRQSNTNQNKPVSKVQAIIFAHNKNRQVEDKNDNSVKLPTKSHHMPGDSHSSEKENLVLSGNKGLTNSEYGQPQSVSEVDKKSSMLSSKTSASSPPTPAQTKSLKASSPPNSESDLYENWGLENQNNASEMGENEWKKQLKRFKEADRRRSTHARRASLQVKKMSKQNVLQEKKLKDLRAKFERRRSVKDIKENSRPTPPPKPTDLRTKHPLPAAGRGPMPASREEAEKWFKETQLSEIVDSEDSRVPKWFHGLISRSEAEQILKNAKVGDFLIRLSDKIWGYALSYKDEEKIKHFLIDGSEPNCYHFFGNDQIRHPGLDELITFHKDEAISYGNETLKDEAGQLNPAIPDYLGLIPTTVQGSHMNESHLTKF